ncbi:hypothetical protein RUM43_007184 [Polyplax serrata]|uniref:FAD-binding domain-containing protein n=1 Tax=Polyplax serrata TaxID=468196 RepID=A0AAN8S8J1_POLSC
MAFIGADGYNSMTRRTLGCQYLSSNYDQKGIVATLKLVEPSENIIAWQRFLPTGPIALLPLTEELCSLVWSIDTKEAENLLKLSDEDFVEAINSAFLKAYPRNEVVSSVTNCIDSVLGRFMLKPNGVQQLPPVIGSVAPKSRAAFPLGFGHATKYVGPGVALIGDAAHRIHPLAGQGVNLGFGDVQCLTDKLAEATYLGNKIGSPTVLARYESERQKQIVPMLTVVHLLQKLYNTSFAPVVLFRSVGLQLTNALGPIKRKIIEQASV